MHEKCAGESQSTRVLNTNIVLLKSLQGGIYPAPCQFLGISSCQPTLMQAIQSLEISTSLIHEVLVLFMSTIDSCARSLFARVLNSSVVYVLSMVLLADFYGTKGYVLY